MSHTPGIDETNTRSIHRSLRAPARDAARRGFTLIGLMLLVTLAALILGLVVSMRDLMSGRHQMLQLKISTDGAKLVGVFGDGRIEVFDTADWRVTPIGRRDVGGLYGSFDFERSLALSSDGKLLGFVSVPLASGEGHRIAIWELERHSLLKEIKIEGDHASDLAFSADNRRLYCVVDGVPRTLDIATETFADWPASQHQARLSALTVSPDGESIVAMVAGQNQSVVAFDSAGVPKQPTYALSGFSFPEVAYSPDGSRLFLIEDIGSGRYLPMVTTLDASNLTVVVKGDILDDRGLSHAEYSSDGKSIFVVSVSPEEIIELDAETLALKSARSLPIGFPWALAARASLLASDSDNVVTLWNLRDGEPTGVTWKYAPGPWRIMLISVGIMLWFVVYAVLRRQQPKPGAVVCRVCGKGLRKKERAKRTCVKCASAFLTAAQARRRGWRMLGIAVALLALAVVGPLLSGGNAFLVEVTSALGVILGAAGATVFLLVGIFLARHYFARYRYLRTVKRPATSRHGKSAGIHFSVAPDGETALADSDLATSAASAGAWQETIRRCAVATRENFGLVTGLPAEFPPDLTVTIYDSAADFAHDLRVYRVEARRLPCLYVGQGRPRVVICPPAVRDNLMVDVDALKIALAWALIGGAEAKHIPTIIGTGIAHLTMLRGDERESQRINRLVLELAGQRAVFGPEMVNVSALQLWTRALHVHNHDEHLYNAMFRTQAASLAEYLTTDAPREQQEAFRGYVSRLLTSGRQEQSLEAALGVPLETVFNEWRCWTQARATPGYNQPNAEQAAMIQGKLAPLVRDRKGSFSDRVIAIRVLGVHGFLLGAETLIDVLAVEEDIDLCREAHTALRMISGKSFGPEPEPWRAWWAEVAVESPASAV